MVYDRSAWKDRFNRPSPEQLRRNFPADAARLFDRARRFVRGLDGIEESVAWYGVSWCWAIEYRSTRRRRSSNEPITVIVPSPLDLQIAMPLDPEFLTSLPHRRLKRSVRDGLDLACEPFDTNWAVWSLQHESMLEELKGIVKRKHAHEIERAG